MRSEFQRRVRSIGIVAVVLSMLSGVSAFPADFGVVSPGAEVRFPPVFSLRFWPGEVELAGAVRNSAAEADLREAVRTAQPDFEIWDIDLGYDSRAPALPPLRELAGLLMELALSTKDGGLHIVEDSITVSGRTDSLVTQAALTTRLEQLSADRFVEVRNEIEVVSSDELRKPSSRRPISVLNPEPLKGFRVEISDEPYGPADPLRARPVELETTAVGGEVEASPASELGNTEPRGSDEAADFDIPLGPVAPVRFEANSFLVGFDQRVAVREAAEMIKALPSGSAKVTLRGYPDAAGESTYHEWLATARAKQVRKMLIDFGVPEARLGVSSATAGSKRQVQIVIPDR